MSFLNYAKKCDLSRLASELKVEVKDSDRQIDILGAILKSENFNEELAKGILNEIQEERKSEAEERKREAEERKREAEERKRKLEAEERKREAEERQKEEERQRKREEDEREIKILQLKYEEEDRKRRHELEMKRLENSGNLGMSNSNPKPIDWQRQLRNFELGNDFTLYLVHFERVMKGVGMDSAQWINCLISALPIEIVEIIMREPEEKAQDYFYVKELLLKRYKLSPEKFRQLFYNHEFHVDQTWREYYHQLDSLFDGWLSGLKIKTFDELKDLIISDRIKKSAPASVREYLMGEWMFLNSPLDLVTKMDEFDELSSLFKQQQKSDVSKPVVGNEYEMNSNSKMRCFNCYGEGHFSRDCIMPRRPKFCTACNTEGHGKKDCTKVSRNSVNLSIVKAVNENACTKIVMINGVRSEAIVDTGADISMMKFSFMETLGFNSLTLQRCSGFPIRGIGGVVQSFGTCFVDVAIDKIFLKNVQFFIVADNTLPGPNVLIGKNLIDFPGVVLMRQEGRSTLLHEKEFKELYNLEVDPLKECVTFRTPESMTIEPPSVQLVSVMSNSERKNGIVSTYEDKFAKEHILTVDNNETIMPITNVSSENWTVKKNKILLRGKYADDYTIYETPSNYDEEKKNEILVTTKVICDPITTHIIEIGPNATDNQRSPICDLLSEYRTTPEEEKCHASRLKLIAAVWSITCLLSILTVLIFVLETNCSSITYLNTQRNMKNQVARWVEKLSEFDYVIDHRLQMAHIDAYRRAPVDVEDFPSKSNEELSDVLYCNPVENMLYIYSEEEKTILIQAQYNEWQTIINDLKTDVAHDLKKSKEIGSYELIDGILCSVILEDSRKRSLFVLPKSMRKYLDVRLHDFSGHFGVDKVYPNC